MAATQPSKLTAELDAELNALLWGHGHFMVETDMRWRRLLKLCDGVQKEDAVAASNLRSAIYVLSGNLDEAVYWAKNVGRLGHQIEAERALASAYCNLGYTSLAARHYEAATAVEGGHTNAVLPLGLAAGCFGAVLRAAQALERAGGELKRADAVEEARLSSSALVELQVREEDVRLLMDRAGEVLRQERLLWIGEAPTIVGTAHHGACLSINYRVATTPESAAACTWNLAERVAESGPLLPGITVGFLGATASADAELVAA